MPARPPEIWIAEAGPGGTTAYTLACLNSCGTLCASGPDLLCGECVCIRYPGSRNPGSAHYDYAMYERATRKPYDLQAIRMTPRTPLRPP
eukprot:5188107-Prymnesium_polylepis.1